MELGVKPHPSAPGSDADGPVKENTPGFPFFLPAWGFGSPGDLGSPQYRPTALPGTLHGTAGSKNEFFPIFHHQKFNRQSPHQMSSWYGLCPLSGCVGGQVRSAMLRR